MDVKSGRTRFYEALLRIDNTDIETFIKEMEQSGETNRVTEFVLKRGASEIKHLSEDISLSINVSPNELENKDFSNHIIEIIEEEKVNPKRLVLELTESSQISNLKNVLENMNELKSIGFRFAMDDFGMGYSNILLLASYPFDYVKTDRNFLSGILENRKKQYLLERVLSMLNGLGIATIVEGVEGSFEYKLLKNFNVDYVQGYYLGKPMPLKQSRNLLRMCIV